MDIGQISCGKQRIVPRGQDSANFPLGEPITALDSFHLASLWSQPYCNMTNVYAHHRKNAKTELLLIALYYTKKCQNKFLCMLLHSIQSIYFNLIDRVRQINIPRCLRGFQNKPLYLVLFSCLELVWEMRDKRHFVLKGFEP